MVPACMCVCARRCTWFCEPSGGQGTAQPKLSTQLVEAIRTEEKRQTVLPAFKGVTRISKTKKKNTKRKNFVESVSRRKVVSDFLCRRCSAALKMANQEKLRPMNYLSVADRVAVINEYDIVPNVPYLARKFHCGRRQIRNILRRRDDYLQQWYHNPNPESMPRRQPARIKAVNTVLFAWCQRALANNVELTDEIIKSASSKIADAIKIVEFQPEKRWLERFKIRNGLDQLQPAALDYAANVGQSLEIEDLVAEMQPEIEKLLTPKYLTEKKKPSKPRSDYSATSENSSDPVDFIDIVSENEQNEDSNEENLLVEIKQNGMTTAYNDDLDSYSSLGIQGFYPSVEIAEEDHNKAISNYKDALNHLGPLEQFALFKENIRAIGLINQIENIFRDEMAKEKQ